MRVLKKEIFTNFMWLLVEGFCHLCISNGGYQLIRIPAFILCYIMFLLSFFREINKDYNIIFNKLGLTQSLFYLCLGFFSPAFIFAGVITLIYVIEQNSLKYIPKKNQKIHNLFLFLAIIVLFSNSKSWNFIYINFLFFLIIKILWNKSTEEILLLTIIYITAYKGYIEKSTLALVAGIISFCLYIIYEKKLRDSFITISVVIFYIVISSLLEASSIDCKNRIGIMTVVCTIIGTLLGFNLTTLTIVMQFNYSKYSSKDLLHILLNKNLYIKVFFIPGVLLIANIVFFNKFYENFFIPIISLLICLGSAFFLIHYLRKNVNSEDIFQNILFNISEAPLNTEKEFHQTRKSIEILFDIVKSDVSRKELSSALHNSDILLQFYLDYYKKSNLYMIYDSFLMRYFEILLMADAESFHIEVTNFINQYLYLGKKDSLEINKAVNDYFEGLVKSGYIKAASKLFISMVERYSSLGIVSQTIDIKNLFQILNYSNPKVRIRIVSEFNFTNIINQNVKIESFNNFAQEYNNFVNANIEIIDKACMNYSLCISIYSIDKNQNKQLFLIILANYKSLVTSIQYSEDLFNINFSAYINFMNNILMSQTEDIVLFTSLDILKFFCLGRYKTIDWFKTIEKNHLCSQLQNSLKANNKIDRMKKIKLERELNNL